MALPWIIFVILGLSVIFGLVAIIVAKKGGKKPTDYYAFFVMGITWLPLGIIMMTMDSDNSIGNIFFILGAIYLILGLRHRKEWKKNHVPFKKLPSKQQKMKIIALVVLGLLLLAGLVVFYIMKKGIFG